MSYNCLQDSYGLRKCGQTTIGLNSRLEFLQLIPLRYAIVLNKPFPQLASFTIALWVNATSLSKNRNSTLLSYSVSQMEGDIFSIMLTPEITLNLYGESMSPRLKLNLSEWTHIVWTMDASRNSGIWKVYINGGEYIRKGYPEKPYKLIPPGGEMVLGQSSRKSQGHFQVKHAFLGTMAFVNIWSHVLSRDAIRAVSQDCTLTMCGDAIQWADFRSGTRGGLRIKWPSRVYGNNSCLVQQKYGRTCENYCSNVNGAKCRAETLANVKWPRTFVGVNASVPCEKNRNNLTSGELSVPVSWRTCVSDQDHSWKWSDPDVTQCTSQDLLNLKQGVSDMSSADLENNITEVTSLVVNYTYNRQITTTFDLATVIDTIETIIEKQKRNLDYVHPSRGARNYGISRRKDSIDYPTWSDTQHFVKDTAKLLEYLVNEKNIVSWSYSKPQGNEGDHFLKTLDDLFDLLARSLEYHLQIGEISYQEACLYSSSSVINFKVQLYTVTDNDFSFSTPYQQNNMNYIKDLGNPNNDKNHPFISIPCSAVFYSNLTNPDYVIVSSAILNISKLVPNHDISSNSKEDHVNSVISSITVHTADPTNQIVETGTLYNITTYFPYLETFNISNPECKTLVHSNGSESWYWKHGTCSVENSTKYGVTCHCNRAGGWFSITVDMYDINWKPILIVNPLMEIPSYIGCLVSSILCLITVSLLIYYKTTSKTAALHKQFGGSIVMVQLIFMVGINRTESTTLCHAFAISFHYFFLSTFLWMMNEAFNLYIVITYAAHSHSDNPDFETGTDWRYFMLGWVLPGVLVGAFVGSHIDDYYASDMCWIAWQYIWLFIGPAIAIISVTILVLIFISKEHYESSYSKNEETNKMISLYCKAVWTQVILLTICWAFAMLSVRMMGTIIKWLYALFNSIQGAFFAVFYFWLNDEVRVLQMEHRKRQQLKYSSDASFEEQVELTHQSQQEECGPSNINEEERSLVPYVRTRLGSNIQEENSSDNSNMSDDDEEGYDCSQKMITTSV